MSAQATETETRSETKRSGERASDEGPPDDGESTPNDWVRWLEELGNDDVDSVGGKNASLGEMIRNLRDEGVRVPGGFATTADAYRAFVEANGIEEKIRAIPGDPDASADALEKAARNVRRAFRSGDFPEAIAEAIREAYRELSRRAGEETNGEGAPVAVRSSATAEDLPEASFAGQQDTYLNVRGEEDLLDDVRRCYASLFTDRAVSYRRKKGFDHAEIALSAGIQEMVRSDLGGAGVMFSLDTDTGFPDAVVINAAWGLGEMVVQGAITPDEYRVFKPRLDDRSLVPILRKSKGTKERKMVLGHGDEGPTRVVDTSSRERRSYVLSDDEILTLARWARTIEDHYGRPMDMEWARDGETGELHCLQARPETVQSRRKASALRSYSLKEHGEPLLSGTGVGDAIAAGSVKVLDSPKERDRFEDGDVLVTGRTDPDWGPILERAAAIVTDHGGRTSHAAIVSRELGIPAVVGTGDATERLEDGTDVTVSCAEGGTGRVYEGRLDFEVNDIDLENLPEPPVRVLMNVASPDGAFRWWKLPARGVGLARIEFLVNEAIGVHPLALTRFDELEDDDVKRRIEELTAGYDDRTEYFVERLARGIASIAASRWPDPVIVRMSDFKTNEYAQLLGGEQFEAHEENPMLGFRGASRYESDRYKDGFALECRAFRRARDTIGLDNLVLMVPFVRTVEEADHTLEALADNGLVRGEEGLRVYMMAEVPSNVLLAEKFAQRFDGFSIGSNDLTQLVLGVDRDAEVLSDLFDERNEAVKLAIRRVIEKAHEAGIEVGICGQAPSDHPGFARFLVDAGIDTISLNPDSVVPVIQRLAGEDGSAAGGEERREDGDGRSAG